MLKKIQILSKIITDLVILIVLLLTTELFLSIGILLNNNKYSEFSQISSTAPINQKDKIFVTVERSKIWTDLNSTVGSVFDCKFINNTNKNFNNWEIRIRIPEGTKVTSFWNINCTTFENFLVITPKNASDYSIKTNSDFSFGFILSTKNIYMPKFITVKGQNISLVRNNIFFNLIMLIILILSAITISSFIIQRSFYKQFNNFEQQSQKNYNLIDQTMRTFVNFIDAKDEYTRGHSARVAYYSRRLAEALGFNRDFQNEIYYMGLMHDIGKLMIPDDILNKSSRLETDEWKIIQMHTTNGGKMLKNFTVIPSLRNAVLYHHERYDGKGYPEGLKGEQIPLVARIICIADSYDAMATNRCYKAKFSKDRILLELERCSGTQFDPKIVPAMIALIKSGNFDEYKN